MGIYDKYLTTRPIRDFLTYTNISVKHKYIYFAISKVANSTIKFYLQEIEYEGTPYRVKTVHDKHCSPLLSPYQLSLFDLESAFHSDEYKKFAFVRNPYSRILSCYLDRIQDPKSKAYRNINALLVEDPREISFGQFLRAISSQHPIEMDSHWRPQVFESTIDLIKLNKVYFLSNYQKTFKISAIFYMVLK